MRLHACRWPSLALLDYSTAAIGAVAPTAARAIQDFAEGILLVRRWWWRRHASLR